MYARETHNLKCYGSNMRNTFSSQDKILRRELKIRLAVDYVRRTSRCLILWWNSVSNVWYWFSNKMILKGEIQDKKWRVFHLISKHSLNFKFLCMSSWIINELKNLFPPCLLLVLNHKGLLWCLFCAQYVDVAESLFTSKEESDKYSKTLYLLVIGQGEFQ